MAKKIAVVNKITPYNQAVADGLGVELREDRYCPPNAVFVIDEGMLEKPSFDPRWSWDG